MTPSWWCGSTRWGERRSGRGLRNWKWHEGSDEPPRFTCPSLHRHHERLRHHLTFGYPHLRVDRHSFRDRPAVGLHLFGAEIHDLELLNRAIGARLEGDRRDAREDRRVARPRGVKEVGQRLM